MTVERFATQPARSTSSRHAASRKLQIGMSANNGRSIEELCREHAISQERSLAWRTATVHGALRALHDRANHDL